MTQDFYLRIICSFDVSYLINNQIIIPVATNPKIKKTIPITMPSFSSSKQYASPVL